MCYVGNMYTNLPQTIRDAHNRECIVEVLGICGVDGKCRAVAHIAAARYLLGGYRAIYAVGCRYDILLEVVG